jgi:hypothetical protein
MISTTIPSGKYSCSGLQRFTLELIRAGRPPGTPEPELPLTVQPFRWATFSQFDK